MLNMSHAQEQEDDHEEDEFDDIAFMDEVLPQKSIRFDSKAYLVLFEEYLSFYDRTSADISVLIGWQENFQKISSQTLSKSV